jgi:hypothetical protein
MLEVGLEGEMDGHLAYVERKHKCRLGGVDDMVLSLSAKGLTTGRSHSPGRSQRLSPV